MAVSKRRQRAAKLRKGPTPRNRSRSATEEATGGPGESRRYTAPVKVRGGYRPGWHKAVGGVSIAVGVTLFIACEASLWGIHNYGGHIWYLLGLVLAASSLWWFGAFDPPSPRPQPRS